MSRPCGVTTLLIAFSAGEESPVAVERDGETVRLTADGVTLPLSREQALALRTAVGDALERRVEFFRTTGRYHRDGSYAVARSR